MAMCSFMFPLVYWQWINPRTLVLMDSTEKLRVVDRPSQEELETVDMAELQLVYNSSHFKSLATGGNVSQALVRTRMMTCQNFHHSVWCMLQSRKKYQIIQVYCEISIIILLCHSRCFMEVACQGTLCCISHFHGNNFNCWIKEDFSLDPHIFLWRK